MSKPEQPVVVIDEGIEDNDDNTLEEFTDMINWVAERNAEFIINTIRIKDMHHKTLMKAERLAARLAAALEKNKQLEEVLDTMSEVLGKRQRI